MPMQLSSPRPHFLRAIIDNGPAVPFQYHPGLSANLTLDRLPVEKHSETAWDNVIYGSPSLGYVVATHMSLQLTLIARSGRGITRSPQARRRRIAGCCSIRLGGWKEFILNDLTRAP